MIMCKKIIVLFILAIFLSPNVLARIYIVVDEASEKKFPIAVPDFVNPKGKKSGQGKKFVELLKKDLEIAGIFQVIDDAVLPKRDSDTTTINFDKWQALEVGALVKGIVEKEGGNLAFKLRLYIVDEKQMILGKKYLLSSANVDEAVHRYVDSLMETLTGIRGPFHSIIAAACGKPGKRGIGTFKMDSTKSAGGAKGGKNSVSPSLSPKGQIAFSAQLPGGEWEIFVGNRQITRFNSTTITPAWTPDGRQLVVAAHQHGNTDLYLMSLSGQLQGRLTQAHNIDYAPSVSLGGQVVFASERAGGLQLFATNLHGGFASQLTYTGYQNDQPDWSPDGSKIVFTGRDRGAFDIFVMNADGSNIMRLTREEGNNESPSWSPDSRYIVFSSTRGGLMVMLEDGSNQTPIEKSGGCVNPDWGPWLSTE